jgi:hypothetical protein
VAPGLVNMLRPPGGGPLARGAWPAAEVDQDGLNPGVLLVTTGQLQLRENGVDVLLDRSSGDEEGLGD